MKSFKNLSLFFCAIFLCFCSFNYSQSTDSLNYYYSKVTSPEKSSDLVSGYRFFSQHKERSLIQKDTAQAVYDLRMMMICQTELGQLYDSEATIVEALDLIKSRKDNRAIADQISLYNELGIIYRKLNNYEKAITTYNEALKLPLKLDDSLSIVMNRANTYRDQKKFPLAEQEFNNVYIERSKLNNIKKTARALDNLGFVQSKLMDPKGLVNMKEALSVRLTLNDVPGVLSSYFHLTDYYVDVNDKLNAEHFAKLALQTSSLYSKDYEIKALSKLLSLNENELIRNYIRLKDSITTSNLLEDNKFAYARYNIKKEQEKRRETELQKEKEKQSKLIYQGIASIIFLIGLFAYLVIRQKHKKEKLLAAYATETRISKKVHDEIANDMFNVMTQLENEQTNPKVIDDLEDIYHRTRDISKENTNINTDEHYADNLTSMLGSYGQSGVKIVLKGVDTIQWKQLSNEKKVILYRVLQEFMTNMRKHSNTKWVTLNFNKSPKKLTVSYADKGVGLTNGKLALGNGLQNVENRILSVKGTLTFDTENEKGFSATIQIPC